MAEIHVLHALKDNFVYALESAGKFVVVDPGEAEPVLEFLRERPLEAILCTHHHADHVAGAETLRQRYNCPVICSVDDRARIPAATQEVREGETISLLNERIEILAMPGHTRGQVAYYWPESNAVFTGDTLFSAGCGRLFEGTPAEMFASLQKFKNLPPSTRVYFGHEYTVNNLNFVLSREDRAPVKAYHQEMSQRRAEGLDTTPSTLAVEYAVNPFLRAQSVEVFAQWRSARDTW